MAEHKYLAGPADDLVVRPMDDITLLFHRPSGATHMVVSPVPEILSAMAMADGAARPVEIVARLSRSYDLGDPAAAVAAVAAHLGELADLGIVRRL